MYNVYNVYINIYIYTKHKHTFKVMDSKYGYFTDLSPALSPSLVLPVSSVLSSRCFWAARKSTAESKEPSKCTCNSTCTFWDIQIMLRTETHTYNKHSLILYYMWSCSSGIYWNIMTKSLLRLILPARTTMTHPTLGALFTASESSVRWWLGASRLYFPIAWQQDTTDKLRQMMNTHEKCH